MKLIPLQESVSVGNKVEVLLQRIASLEALFATPPGDVDEQRRRYDLIWYVVIPPYARTNLLALTPPPVSLRASRGSCGRCTGNWSRRSPLLTVPEAMKMCLGPSRIYKKQSSSIRFVRDLRFCLKLTRTPGGGTNVDWQSRIQLNGECLLSRLGKRSDPLNRTQVGTSSAHVSTMTIS